jgi:hypothetical protein
MSEIAKHWIDSEWTASDINISRRVSCEIHAGAVWTNVWAAINDGFAESGFKQSGIGRLRGPWPSPSSRKPRPSSTPSRRFRANPPGTRRRK